jgi:hypothetical protein
MVSPTGTVIALIICSTRNTRKHSQHSEVGIVGVDLASDYHIVPLSVPDFENFLCFECHF